MTFINQKWFRILLKFLLFALFAVLVVVVILGFVGIFTIQPDPSKFFLYEGLTALWGFSVLLVINISIWLFRKLPQYKNYIWSKRINSLKRRIGHDLTYRIYRKVNIKPDNLPLALENFKQNIETCTQDLHIKKLVKKEWKINALCLELKLHSNVLSSLECIPHIQEHNDEMKVFGFTIFIEAEGKFKQMDKLLRDNDSLMKSIVYDFGFSLERNNLDWETPILEIHPLKHFIKDSYWLSQMAEKSVITIRLKEDILVSLAGEKLTVKLLSTDRADAVFVDDKFTYHLQQAIATFYGEGN